MQWSKSMTETQMTEDALGRFDARGGAPDEDLTDDEWMEMVCQSLAADLMDSRQDIYSANS